MSVGDDFLISSEIQEKTQIDYSAVPNISPENVVSLFSFALPADRVNVDGQVFVDQDGDLIVRRRSDAVEVIAIEHSRATPLGLVGQQVWRGALLLADFLLHQGCALAGHTLLELGAGVGLTSIVAAMFSREVICTDVDRGGILELMRGNAARNADLLKARVTVLGLDFFSMGRWSPTLAAKLPVVDVVLAADVIYDNDVTEAFVDTLVELLRLPPTKTVYIALEKRYVFTVADLDCCAPCYEFFVQCLSQAVPPGWTCEQLPLDFPQYFRYDRVKELVLWRLTS
ncbi:methyltransferase-like protein 22 isoform X1 [Bacillus rossius redtenbacheri]|uniref:methyltransferase-like protein 22 isoform X1 n=1 Tax=Bacillus rossius redtenbacheri TaxID=93214 RepID=UPI002FDE7E7C